MRSDGDVRAVVLEEASPPRSGRQDNSCVQAIDISCVDIPTRPPRQAGHDDRYSTGMDKPGRFVRLPRVPGEDRSSSPIWESLDYYLTLGCFGSEGGDSFNLLKRLTM